MKLTVKNFRGATDADITIKPIALIAGNNGAGKSSIAQAAAAVLSGNPAPLAGFKKNQSKQLLTEGAKNGFATLGDAKITFPTGTFKGEGVKSSPVAAGLEHPLDMKPADSAKYFGGLLKADPTVDDLTEALPEIKQPAMTRIWEMIENQGWDAAHKQAKEKGTKLKGQWEMVTGINYGAKVADGWVPPEFESNGVPEKAALEAKLDTQKTAHDELVGKRAVGADRLEQAQKYADMMPQLQADLDIASKHHETMIVNLEAESQAVTKAQAYADSLPDPGDEVVTVDCPNCGDHLIVVSATKLISADDAPDPEEVKRQQDEIIQAGKALRAANDKLKAAQLAVNESSQQIDTVKRNIDQATKAADFLTTANTEGSSDEDIQSAQHAIEDTQYLMAQLENMERAKTIVESIKQNGDIISALAPEGVRKTVLLARLGEVNASLTHLSATAKYKPVALSEALTFTYDGRSFELLSESEQYRVRLIFQLYAALYDHSELVIIDRADLLDNAGRSGLFRAVKSTSLHALICMTISKREDVPKLPESLGEAYWVENGVADRA